MNSDFKNEYEDLIKGLSSLKDVRASKKLAKKISLLAEQKRKTKSLWPQLLLTRAAFFAVILALLTGGGIYASEKVDSKKVVEPIKNAAIQFQATLKQKSTTEKSEEAETKNKREENASQDSENLKGEASSNNETAADNKDSNNNVNDPTPKPTSKPESVLGDVSEELPEPAKGVVEGVSEALENNPSSEKGQGEKGEENNSNENKKAPPVNIDIDPQNNGGSENSENNIDININLPF